MARYNTFFIPHGDAEGRPRGSLCAPLRLCALKNHSTRGVNDVAFRVMVVDQGLADESSAVVREVFRAEAQRRREMRWPVQETVVDEVGGRVELSPGTTFPSGRRGHGTTMLRRGKRTRKSLALRVMRLSLTAARVPIRAV